MDPLNDLVARAQHGDLEAFGELVRATQVMAYAVALGVLRDRSIAEDAVQEAYLRAFRRLRDLHEPAAFVSWLRRLVITVALNIRPRRKLTNDRSQFPRGDVAHHGLRVADRPTIGHERDLA
jgi:RNA polymerase sigma-70 factor (ECF subfamily)